MAERLPIFGLNVAGFLTRTEALAAAAVLGISLEPERIESIEGHYFWFYDQEGRDLDYWPGLRVLSFRAPFPKVTFPADTQPAGLVSRAEDLLDRLGVFAGETRPELIKSSLVKVEGLGWLEANSPSEAQGIRFVFGAKFGDHFLTFPRFGRRLATVILSSEGKAVLIDALILAGAGFVEKEEYPLLSVKEFEEKLKIPEGRVGSFEFPYEAFELEPEKLVGFVVQTAAIDYLLNFETELVQPVWTLSGSAFNRQGKTAPGEIILPAIKESYFITE